MAPWLSSQRLSSPACASAQSSSRRLSLPRSSYVRPSPLCEPAPSLLQASCVYLVESGSGGPESAREARLKALEYRVLRQVAPDEHHLGRRLLVLAPRPPHV